MGETGEGLRSEVRGFRNLESRPSNRVFLACLVGHAPQSVVLADFFSILLAADNEKVAWSNDRAGEAILCLERLERDAKPFRHFP